MLTSVICRPFIVLCLHYLFGCLSAESWAWWKQGFLMVFFIVKSLGTKHNKYSIYAYLYAWLNNPQDWVLYIVLTISLTLGKSLKILKSHYSQQKNECKSYGMQILDWKDSVGSGMGTVKTVIHGINKLGLIIVIYYLFPPLRHLSFSTKRNERIRPPNSLQYSSREIAYLLTAKKTISLNLTLISVSPIRLYLPRRAICFWKQVVLCVLLLLNSPAPSARLLCPIWIRRKRILSVCTSWRKYRPQEKSGRWRRFVASWLDDFGPRFQFDKSVLRWELAHSQEWVKFSDSGLCAAWIVIPSYGNMLKRWRLCLAVIGVLWIPKKNNMPCITTVTIVGTSGCVKSGTSVPVYLSIRNLPL